MRFLVVGILSCKIVFNGILLRCEMEQYERAICLASIAYSHVSVEAGIHKRCNSFQIQIRKYCARQFCSRIICKRVLEVSFTAMEHELQYMRC